MESKRIDFGGLNKTAPKQQYSCLRILGEKCESQEGKGGKRDLKNGLGDI